MVRGELSGPEVITTTEGGGLGLYAHTPWHNDGVYTYTQLYVGAGTDVILSSHYTDNLDYTDDLGVELHLDNLTVAEGATISADGQGYGPSKGPGKPTSGNGAGHGGYGTNGASPYGNLYWPETLGSGGSSGDGGGAVHLVVSETFALSGTLSADGINGGSGGSILIDTEVITITDNGMVRADGGNSGGAGGRIAIYADDAYFSPISKTLQSRSDSGGGPGTIYFSISNTLTLSDTLLVDNGNYDGQSAGLAPETSETTTYEFTTIVLTRCGYLTVISTASVLTLTTETLVGDGTARLIGEGMIVAPEKFVISNTTVVVRGELSGAKVITTTENGGLELHAYTPWHNDGVYTYTQLYVGTGTTVTLASIPVNEL